MNEAPSDGSAATSTRYAPVWRRHVGNTHLAPTHSKRPLTEAVRRVHAAAWSMTAHAKVRVYVRVQCCAKAFPLQRRHKRRHNVPEAMTSTELPLTPQETQRWNRIGGWRRGGGGSGGFRVAGTGRQRIQPRQAEGLQLSALQTFITTTSTDGMRHGTQGPRPRWGTGGAFFWKGGGASLPAAGGAYWPLATCLCPSLAPFSSVGGGCSPSASHHLVPSRPLPGLPLPPHIPLLSLGRFPAEPPDCPCVTALCRVHMGGTALVVGHVCPSGHPHTGGGGPLPNGGFWAPGCPLAGSLEGGRLPK